jgi:hypothetical protein
MRYAPSIGLAFALSGSLLLVWCGPGPVPHPSPSPTVAPTATPAPTPTPCVVPPDGPQWQPVESVAPLMVKAVRDAQVTAGDACGAPPEWSLDRLAGVLVAAGYCAARQSDAVMVRRADGLYEEHHAVAFGNGCWIATPFRGIWSYRQ